MVNYDCPDEWCRLASFEEVAEIERPRIDPSRFTIICGPCQWNVHTDLFEKKVWGGPLERIYRDDGDRQQGKKSFKIQGQDVFIFARLLQFIYYGTYSYKANDRIPNTANLARPGFEGLSPALIVQSALTTKPDDIAYKTVLSKDETTTTSFGHEIDLTLYSLADKYKVRGLKEHALKKYSSFPFRNHREFYHSVIDTWPIFPFIEEDMYDPRYHYDEAVLRAVAPHIARFWKEARQYGRNPHRVEARRIQKWIKGKKWANKKLLADLLDAFVGIDLEEQNDWDYHCMDVDCTGCRTCYAGEWSDGETDMSKVW